MLQKYHDNCNNKNVYLRFSNYLLVLKIAHAKENFATVYYKIFFLGITLYGSLVFLIIWYMNSLCQIMLFELMVNHQI